MASTCTFYDLDHAVRIISFVEGLSLLLFSTITYFFVHRNNQASAYPPACPQNGLNYAQSEDCLYLTIYVPVKAAAAGTSLNTFLWYESPLFLISAPRETHIFLFCSLQDSWWIFQLGVRE